MRKRKNGPALFELIGDRALSSRATVRPEPAIVPPPAASPRDAGSALRDVATETDIAPIADIPLDAAKSASFEHPLTETVVQFEGDRVRVSLSSIGAAVATFVVIVFLAGGFLLGKSRGRQDGLQAGYEAGRSSFEAGVANDIEAARNQPAATYLIGGLLEDQGPQGVSTALPEKGGDRIASDRPGSLVRERRGDSIAPRAKPADAGQPMWVDGFTYIVAQEFPGAARADAEAAQSYLEQHGVPTAIQMQPGGRLLLMTHQGYNRKDPVQRKLSDQLSEKVRAIGAQYYASGGRYRLEGYLKTHKNES